MAGIVFRKSALDKISSLDQLDQTMKVVKPYDFISVIAMLVIVFAALVWSIVGSIPEQVTAMGVLISSDEVIDVTYTNQGSVKHVFVERGDFIKNGEVIARIERTDMLDQITQAQTTIDNLLKTQELINKNTKNGISKERRMRELFEKGLITENDYVASKQNSLDIDRQVNEKKHELAVLKENYQKATRVVAPTSGVILEVSVDKNDYVNAGTTIALIGKDKSSPSEAILFIAATDGKIIAMMDRVFPEYQDFFSNMFGKTSVQIMKECTSPEQILEIPTEKLTEMLKKASRGRFKESKAKELKELASNSFAAMLSSDMISLLIRQMLEQIDLLEKQISDIEQIIAAHFAEINTKIATIPGVGTTLGATILSEIGDINRFEKPKQLIAFAGMDPSVKQSGNFVGTESHMSKRGSTFLRRAIWLASVVAVSHDPLFKYLFQQKMASGKNYSQAMGYICHKLLNTIFAILKTGEEYKPIYPPEIDVSKLANEAINSQK